MSPPPKKVSDKMSHQRKSCCLSPDIICAFNFIKLTPSNLKQLGKCPSKELPKKYLQIHLRIKEMFDPNLKHPNATRFSSLFFLQSFILPSSKKGLTVHYRTMTSTIFTFMSPAWSECYCSQTLCWGKPTALSLLHIWADKSKSQMTDQH